MSRLVVCFFFSFLLCNAQASAKVIHGVYVSNRALAEKAKEGAAADMAAHPLFVNIDKQTSAIERPRGFKGKNEEFLVAVILLGSIGVFKATNGLYFRNMWAAFGSVSLSKRQLKDQLGQDQRSSLFMNIFFLFSVAIYTYLVLHYFYENQDWIQQLFRAKLVALLLLLFAALYLMKFLFLQVIGWILDIQELVDNYLFQIFLTNKILGILLLPFTLILAFGEGAWVQVSLLLSFAVLIVMAIYRYTRSISLFQHFLRLSKFHFFMYLCASEILPLLVLVKIAGNWLSQA